MSSLLQWDPQNIVVDSTSRYIHGPFFFYLSVTSYVRMVVNFELCRVVQSFEVVVYLFAQQLTLNDTQKFALPLLTVVAELVSSSYTSHFQNFNVIKLI